MNLHDAKRAQHSRLSLIHWPTAWLWITAIVAVALLVTVGFAMGEAAKVLPELGLDFEHLAEVNPRIVVVRMPAFGTTGPYSDAAGYGTVVEGMGGLGARFGYEHEGARITDLYWPDPVSGAIAVLAVLTGIEPARPHRRRQRHRRRPHGGDVVRARGGDRRRRSAWRGHRADGQSRTRCGVGLRRRCRRQVGGVRRRGPGRARGVPGNRGRTSPA